ncbi:MAG: lytic transglycosylase domain-containing protein [Thermodesulfobacteriota bacterium]|nr:lytic transglycosylase domain-containing protein [Thermodesulfobacteriota bacterium]
MKSIIDELAKSCHSRENGNPENSNYIKKLDSCWSLSRTLIRDRNDRKWPFRILYKTILIASLLFFHLVLLAGPSFAGIYRWVDERGVIHFTNCPRDPQFKLYIRESKDDVGGEENNSSIPTVRDQSQFDSLIEELSKKHNVDSALVKAMIKAESGFNPLAVSRKGAKGLMQLMPETAQRMNVANIFNPRENIDGGVRYFRHLLSLFNNDLRLSLAAYNAGENIVSELRSIPPYRETVDYVRKVLNYYQSYKP